jgi:hypothetical protein
MENKMKTDEQHSFLETIPSWALAVYTLIGATIILFVVGESIQRFERVGYIAYILNDLVLATGCFFIIRTNPKSLWYVLLICNAVSIIAAFVEPTFWRTSLWIPNCAGWALMIIVAIVARRIGKRTASKVEA